MDDDGETVAVPRYLLHCRVCYDVLDNPKVLWCGHRFCADCVRGLLKMQNAFTEVQCPMCRRATALAGGALDKLGTDFDAQEMIRFTGLKPQQSSETKAAAATPQSVKKDSPRMSEPSGQQDLTSAQMETAVELRRAIDNALEPMLPEGIQPGQDHTNEDLERVLIVLEAAARHEDTQRVRQCLDIIEVVSDDILLPVFAEPLNPLLGLTVSARLLLAFSDLCLRVIRLVNRLVTAWAAEPWIHTRFMLEEHTRTNLIIMGLCSSHIETVENVLHIVLLIVSHQPSVALVPIEKHNVTGVSTSSLLILTLTVMSAYEASSSVRCYGCNILNSVMQVGTQQKWWVPLFADIISEVYLRAFIALERSDDDAKTANNAILVLYQIDTMSMIVGARFRDTEELPADRLCAAITSTLQAHREQPDLTENILGFLSIVSTAEDVADNIIDTPNRPTVNALLEALSLHHANPILVRYACTTFNALTWSQSAREALVHDHNIDAALTRILKEYATNGDVSAVALGTLCNLASSDMNPADDIIESFLSCGAIDAAVDVFRSSLTDADIVRECVLGFSNYVRYDPARVHLSSHESDLFSLILQCLNDATVRSTEITTAGCLIIAGLADSEDMDERSRFGTRELVEVLQQIVEQFSDDAVVVYNALNALAHATTPTNSAVLVSYNAHLVAIEGMSSLPQSQDVQHVGCIALSFLADDRKNVGTLLAAGVDELANVALSTHAKSLSVRDEAAHLLYKLSTWRTIMSVISRTVAVVGRIIVHAPFDLLPKS